MANQRKKNILKTPTRERSLFVRILAILIVVIIIVALVFTMLPAYLFADTGVIHIDGDMLNEDGSLPLVIDDADILTEGEEAELREGLEKFREAEDFDIVAVTVYSLGDMDVVEYADRFYDENGYGGGTDHDGALMIVSTEYRDWTMITAGYGNSAITDYGLDVLEEEILPFLKDGRYSDGFKTFGDGCAYYVTEARKGNIIDLYEEETPDSSEDVISSNQGRGAYPIAANAGIAGVIGLVISFFTNGRKRSQLKSVRYRNQAKDYVRKNSLTLTDNRDRYLYTDTKVVHIPDKDDDDHHSHHSFGGGTTLHQSPSGNLHGGGHAGKF